MPDSAVVLHEMAGCHSADADHGEDRIELLEQRREARETVRACHKILDRCQVPREEVITQPGSQVQEVIEFPLTDRLEMLLQAWAADRKGDQ